MLLRNHVREKINLSDGYPQGREIVDPEDKWIELRFFDS